MKIPMRAELVAPCGVNCAVCAAFLSFTHGGWKKGLRIPECPGCLPRPKNCANFKKWCPRVGKGRVRFCSGCPDFPCSHMKGLDGRYRARYRTSPIDNLVHIRDRGMRSFLASQRRKWRCPRCGGLISVHNGLCFSCDEKKLKAKKKKYSWDE